jgi:tRNA(adenine34) deaminase
MTPDDERWMTLAIEQARLAQTAGEVPIGAVILDADGRLIASAHNLTITNSDPTAHAEIIALRQAAAKIGNYRLTGSTVYSTIEPCVMCAGALVNARVERLVFGAADERFGGAVTQYSICDDPRLNHRMLVEHGVLEDECRRLMQDFFRSRRRSAQ